MGASFQNPKHEANLKREFFLSREFNVLCDLRSFEKKSCEWTVMMNRKTKKQIQIGRVLTRLMNEQGLTVKELSFRCGVPASTISHMKQNRPPRDLSSAQVIAECLAVSLTKLLFDEDEKVRGSNEQSDWAQELFSGVFEVTVKRSKK